MDIPVKETVKIRADKTMLAFERVDVVMGSSLLLYGSVWFFSAYQNRVFRTGGAL